MNTKTEYFDEKDLDQLYRQYQSSRASQLPDSYLKTITTRRQVMHETSAAEETSEDSELYREYLRTRDARVEQGIQRVMTAVHERAQNLQTAESHVHVQHPAESESRSARYHRPGISERFGQWRDDIWQSIAGPAWGSSIAVATLLILAVLPWMSDYFGDNSDKYLAFAPSSTTALQSEIMSAQITGSESSILGYAGASADTQAFRIGATSVDLLMVNRIPNNDQNLLVLRNLEKLHSKESQSEVARQLLKDIRLLADASKEKAYTPGPLLKLLQETYTDSKYVSSYELGQWIETLILEASLAEQTKETQRLNQLITDSSTTKHLLFIVQQSDVPPKIARRLQDALTKSPIELSSIKDISKLAQDLKYIY